MSFTSMTGNNLVWIYIELTNVVRHFCKVLFTPKSQNNRYRLSVILLVGILLLGWFCRCFSYLLFVNFSQFLYL